MADEAGARKNGGLDFATVAGLVVGIGAILGGLVLEGGQIKDVAQITAAIIVLGGTLGAVMISTPIPVLKGAMKRLGGVVKDPLPPMDALLDEIIEYATRARREGLVSLEDASEGVADPFLRKALMLAVDGSDLQEIRSMLELEIDIAEAQAEAEAKVFEGAGGYAPTIGIIGAVMGLIQVMKNLANIEEVGHGIAVAFVATLYGVGASNLLFLPMAQKIKARAHAESKRRTLIVEGIGGIIEGLNPKLLRSKLQPFAPTGSVTTGVDSVRAPVIEEA